MADNTTQQQVKLYNGEPTWPAIDQPGTPEIAVIQGVEYGSNMPSPAQSLAGGASAVKFDGASNRVLMWGEYGQGAPNSGSVRVDLLDHAGVLLGSWWVVAPQGAKLDGAGCDQDGTNLQIFGEAHAGVDPNRFYEKWQAAITGILVAYPNGNKQEGGIGAGYIPSGQQGDGGMTLDEFVAALNSNTSPLSVALDRHMKNDDRVAIATEAGPGGSLPPVVQSKAADALVEVLNRANHDTDPKAKEVLDALFSLVGDDIWTDLNKVWSGQEQPSGKNASQMYQEFLAAVRAGR